MKNLYFAKHFLLVFLIWNLCHSNGFAENNDTTKIKNLLSKAREVFNNDFSLAKVYTDSSLVLIKKHISRSKGSANDYKTLLVQAEKIVGDVYFYRGDTQRGLSHYFDALKVAEEIKDNKQANLLHDNISACYIQLRFYAIAQKYLQKAIDNNYQLLQKDPANEWANKRLLVEYTNMGILFSHKNEFKKTIYYLEKALQLKHNASSAHVYKEIYYNLANCYGSLNDTKNASYYYEKTIAAITDTTDKLNLTQLYISQGNYYFQKGEYKKAIEALKKAETQCIINDERSLINHIYFALIKVYQKNNDYKNEALCFRKINAETDTSFFRMVENYQIELEQKYQANKKEKEILELSKEKVISNMATQEAETKRNYSIAALILLLLITTLLIVIAIVLRNKNREQRINNQLLNERNKELIEKSELISKQASEIARQQSQMNPHFIFNALSGIQSMVVNNENQQALEQLVSFSKLMRMTLTNSEQDLITLKNELEFLQRYIDFELKRFENRFIYRVTIDSAIDPNNTLLMPMLIQPFIENAIKHAGLNNTSGGFIALTVAVKSEDCIKITIEDNGKGINESDLTKEESKAINITKRRLELLQQKHPYTCMQALEIRNTTHANSTGVSVVLRLPYIKNF